MSTAEAAIQTHCDKIDSLAAQQDELVAAMNQRMERDAETIRVLREACIAAKDFIDFGVECLEVITGTRLDAIHTQLDAAIERAGEAVSAPQAEGVDDETREAGPDLQST